ncbi:DUF2599 domain-containing protein [Pseudomonas chlororaphis]|uniref:DUF2599 domain-containing protein n=1 Tax=Pseudomonas chlororaphis TaxID=587753 RepID=UPI001E427220|nr:DUF2599 domain-containing protein [Pseudomonas chlororaphis]MCB2251622.1 DUF2599 domain-containing protein [Pseudomonas chlororaphis]
MKKRLHRIAPLLLLPVLAHTALARAESCEETLRQVEKLYNNTVASCGKDPASDCSGLLIRGTHRADPAKGQQWDVWNPSPKARELGTFAASWMRADGISYEDPGMSTQNGYIIKPIDLVRDPETPVHIYCAFPNDAWTDFRDDRGCGNNKNTSQTEAVCQAMVPPITNPTAWVAHFTKFNNNRQQDQLQCGFNMRNPMSSQDRVTAFQNFMGSRRVINTREFQTQTELRLGNPKDDELPILAFFYSDQRGLNDALANQRDYKNKTGKDRNIVKIDFPRTPNGKASFSCTSAAPLPTPQFCDKYIESSSWVKRPDPKLGPDTWSLQVVPTACGRAIKDDQTDRMFAEIYNKHKNDDQWRQYSVNGGSLRRQMVCHLAATFDGKPVRDKPEWNLEPARPYVDQATAVAQRCNPY